MAWRFFDEPVEMVEQRFRYFPRLFRWRGERHEVEEVERCWTVCRSGWRRRERRFFRVQCSAGTFELYQDLRTGIWYLRRARLTLARVAPFQQVVPV